MSSYQFSILIGDLAVFLSGIYRKTSNMKILIIGGKFSGITSAIVKALKSKNQIDVTVAVPTLKALKFRWLLIAFIALESVFTYGTNFKRCFNRTWFWHFAQSLSCDALIKKHTPDAVIQMGANNMNFFWGKINTIFTIFTDHTNLLSKKLPDYGFDIPEKQVSQRWNRIEEHILKSQDYIFVMSKNAGNSIVFDYGVAPDKIKFVGAGPNINVDIERDGIEKNFSDKNILFVGLDAKRKGLPDLIAAFDKVQKQHPNAKLHIAGINGNSSNSIKYYGEIHGEELKNLFYRSQIFCLPTYREPFGIVFIEAMYSKCVCISTDIEAIPEIINHKKTGYLCSPKDIDAIAKNINELFSDPNKLREMAELGYQKAKKNWNWDKTIDQILFYFES